MSKQGKFPQPKLKARREISQRQDFKISIRLQYLTTNKNFTFEYFDKTFRDKVKAFEQFTEFLQRLTTKTILEISALSKFDDCGFETIPFVQIRFNPNGVSLGKDTKIHVFRFGNGGNYRMLGFFESGQAVLNIIGFDFDYSAYQH